MWLSGTFSYILAQRMSAIIRLIYQTFVVDRRTAQSNELLEAFDGILRSLHLYNKCIKESTSNTQTTQLYLNQLAKMKLRIRYIK